MELSVCIIVKNEEKRIARCLESIAGYPFEVVVIDTGSTDGTKEVAEKYQVKVFDFEWCDDFAAAKNYAIKMASNPFVLVLDSDEYVEEIDLEKVERLLRDKPKAVGRIQRRNFYHQDGIQRENVEWINRVFAKEYFHYEGRIHEQVVALDSCEYEAYTLPITIGHTGYELTEQQKREKAQRNITLLQQELERLQNKLTGAQQALEKLQNKSVNEQLESMQQACMEQIPYIYYQLGKSEYLAGGYEQACEYFNQGLSFDLDPGLEYLQDMVETYGYAMLESGHNAEALAFESIYDTFAKSADFQFLMGLIYMNNARFTEAVQEFLKATKHTKCKMVGNNSYLAYYNIGVIYECQGKLKEAVSYYKKCNNYEPAQQRVNIIERV